MKLYYSPTSPYVRKVLVVAHEAGILDRITLLASAPSPVKPDAEVQRVNPLGQIPALILDDGTMIADSRVICEYLDAQTGGNFVPAAGAARWSVLTEESTADGMTAAALLCRYEMTRPENFRWQDWYDGQLAKIHAGLDFFERRADSFSERVDLGTISAACGLSYLQLRFGDIDWLGSRPALARWYARFCERASMCDTVLGVSRLPA